MNYLVTGGAGFIGSHIVSALLEQGANVRVLDNFSTGKRENIDVLIRQFGQDSLEVMEGDIRDASRVGEAVRGVNVIFHSAAFVSVPQSMDEPQECFDVNLTGTSLLFDAARKAGVRRASDCFERGSLRGVRCAAFSRGNAASAEIPLCSFQASQRNVRGVVHEFV